MTFALFFLLAFVVSLLLSFAIRSFALRHNIVDDPQSAPTRKFHITPTPLLGGVAIFGAVQISLGIALFSSPLLTDSFLYSRQLIGIILAGFVIVVGGVIDDVRRLKPLQQIIWPAAAALIVIACGIGIPYISNPFGGVISLESISFQIFSISGIAYSITLLADLFTFVWLMVLMYAMKFLDGLDGLATGVGLIGALTVFALSLTDTLNQPGTALIAIIIAGAFAGFLSLNRFPAKIFLGESGSVYVGFLLGLLSIVSGGKIATALLILAFPLLDIAWVLFARIKDGKKIWEADRRHLHFRLLDRGLSVNKTVAVLYGASILFGLSAFVFDARLKAIFLSVALLASLALLWFASRKNQTA